MLYTSIKDGLFLLAKEKRVSPMTTLTGNQSICLEMFSERGLEYNSMFSVHFRMGLLTRKQEKAYPH